MSTRVAASLSTTSAAARVGLVAEFERETARRAAVALAMEALKTRDHKTALHSDDVLTLCDALGRRLKLDERQLARLSAGAQLHDVGKVGVPTEIINKPTALTEAEWAVIREHTVIGERIVRSVPALADVAPIVRHSHEHWDGSGYPDGLSGDAIPLASRVILCADAFHAMRCDRPYRRGRDALAAQAELEACAGTQFDPAVVDAFTAVAGAARNGSAIDGDRFRKKRLLVLLTALAIGAGSAFAAIPEVREAVKSLFATSIPPSHAAAEPLVREDFNLGPLGDALRLPSAEGHKNPSPATDTKASAPVTDVAAGRVGPSNVAAERVGPSNVVGDSEPVTVRPAQPDLTGRALGRDVPIPRRPAQPPSQLGGRTDPPALGLHAGPNGAAKRHSK